MAYRRKSKYTSAEKRAYHSGQGYRVAYSGRGIRFKNSKLKAAFRAGFESQGRTMSKVPTKYPKLK